MSDDNSECEYTGARGTASAIGGWNRLRLSALLVLLVLVAGPSCKGGPQPKNQPGPDETDRPSGTKRSSTGDDGATMTTGIAPIDELIKPC